MKILHIGDQAGSAAITSNICTKLGHPSAVVQDKSIDTFRHGEYYNNTIYIDKDDMFTALKVAIDSGYEHFVYHDQIALAIAADHLNVASSYMFHGNMLRQQPSVYQEVLELNNIDNIFVTTEDLQGWAPEAILFNRPVDLDLFYNDNNPRIDAKGLCLTQDRYLDIIVKMMAEADNEVFVVDRVKNRIRYEDMPNILNHHRIYYDIKFQPTHPPTMIDEMSQTGLQALACGLTVWSNDHLFCKFPMKHSDEVTAREFIKVLEE